MRDPRELLALLTEKIVSLDRESGGVPEITQDDISHAMGFIRDPNASLLVGVKYCGRSGDIHKLDLTLWLEAAGKSNRWEKDEGYTRRKEFIRRMCQMALNEYMDQHLCPTCNGTSPVLRENLKNAFHKDHLFCETCRDIGRVYPSDEFRAEVMGINPKLWQRSWSDKYREIQAILYNWESLAVTDLIEALREPQAC